MSKKKKEFVLEAFLFSGLRRLSYKYPARNAVKVKARVSRGKYRCAACEDLFGPRQIAIDHIEPVINPDTGFKDWNTYIQRLFCAEENLQVLCKSCHNKKSKEENKRRRELTKKKKKVK